MSWQHWTLFVVLALGALLSFTDVNKPRSPKSMELAFASFLFGILMVTLLVWGEA